MERDRVLSIGEVRQLSDALPPSGLQTRFAAGVWLILSTGVRVGELLGATWADADQDSEDLRSIGDQADVKVGFVDLAHGTWHIPVTKNQRSHTIHLSDFARAQFKQLDDLRMSRSDNTRVAEPMGLCQRCRRRSGRREDTWQAVERQAARCERPAARALKIDDVIVLAGWTLDRPRSAANGRNVYGRPGG